MKFAPSLRNAFAAVLLFAPAVAFAGEVDFRTLKAGQYSGLEANAEYVITNAQDYQQLWTNLHRNIVGETPVAPEVNFDAETVVGIARSYNTGGYSVEIQRVVQEKQDLVVEALVVSPGQSCFTTQALTQPHHFVAVPKAEGKVQFDVQHEVAECE